MPAKKRKGSRALHTQTSDIFGLKVKVEVDVVVADSVADEPRGEGEDGWPYI